MAAFLPSQADFDPVKYILEWQSQQLQVQPSDYVEEAAHHNVVASLSASLTSLFKAIIPALSLPEQEQDRIPQTARISLERSCSALILWSDGYGIAEGRLNDTLNRSRKLRYTTLKNLLHIGRVLVERLVPLIHVSEKPQELCSSVESNIEEAASIIIEASSRRSDDSSSDAASDFSNDDIHEIAEDLKTDTLVLSSLDPLLKCPIFDTQYNVAADGLASSTWSPEQLFSNRIEHRFPSAGTPLASRLGRINYDRYLRCQAMRDAQQREEPLSMMIQEGQSHAGTMVADSKLRDSGVGKSLGMSAAPKISYAETTMSYNHEGQSVRIPPLSEEAKSGLLFSCVACGRTILIANNSGWKRHIYLDLQPYMCLDMSCPHSSNTFESREKWIAHLALDHEMAPHWESIHCALCKEQTGRGKMAVTMHFAKHLEEISLSALPIDMASNAASEDTISFFSELIDGESDRNRGPLPLEGDAAATETRHSVQSSHDLDGPDPDVKARSLGTPSDDEALRIAAAQGDLESVARILQGKDSFDRPEAMVAAARHGHDLVLQLLLDLGGASPDPYSVHTSLADIDFPAPMLAAIGQRNIKVIEILLEQKGFDPTRTFNGETYHEIARRRQGPNWEKEYHILRTAYSNYKQTHITSVEDNSPGTSAGADDVNPIVSHTAQHPQCKLPGTNASFLPDDSSATEAPTSRVRSRVRPRRLRGDLECPVCGDSFDEGAERERHIMSLHIKDYHDFLATVETYFKDQQDKSCATLYFPIHARDVDALEFLALSKLQSHSGES
ncbi:hypothetical protein BBK36DRAFT_21428 [Trichoderma citrinoviride]|uniref:C2H2-type domain-containing protein n=1 Tax=Trichoderma citrinoviride TaxID=58853 RepID=A0A2T4B5Q9_9HYPO|nr:hypothetical protein BBK36DRAFT_21428 [Trichoderma citrinoviride]PTB64677.1 hypothetical protein BBK36DRAFT_21428 [Trichoderma citrinoviride]